MSTEKNHQDLEALGKKLKAAREEAGLTQQQVAKQAKTTVTYYAMIERGEANPSYQKLQRILKVLKKTLDIL